MAETAAPKPLPDEYASLFSYVADTQADRSFTGEYGRDETYRVTIYQDTDLTMIELSHATFNLEWRPVYRSFLKVLEDGSNSTVFVGDTAGLPHETKAPMFLLRSLLRVKDNTFQQLRREGLL